MKRIPSICALLSALVLLLGCGGEQADGQDGGSNGHPNGWTVDCMDNPLYCDTKDDCAPVGCKCICEACGRGFSYEEVVNVACVESWYQTRQCAPTVCRPVCCPVRVLVCENHVCKAVEGKY
ncbi:MAG: hypothetical protein JXR96_06780 [Deltaproteobacteria bacterium]|nr:hypothetical protein [Deltaproteobacteria bacterium]